MQAVYTFMQKIMEFLNKVVKIIWLKTLKVSTVMISKNVRIAPNQKTLITRLAVGRLHAILFGKFRSTAWFKALST
jgi:hypothetical protein